MSSVNFCSWCYSRKRGRGVSPRFPCCFCVWCKSRELGGRGSPRFPLVSPVVESFFSDLLRGIISYWEESHLKSCQTSTMSSPAKKTNGFNTLTISAKKLHRRCSAGLRMCLRLKVLSIYGVWANSKCMEFVFVQ